MKTKLYRAANDTSITGPTSFASDLDVAEAYLDNPGFGGTTLYTATVDIDAATVLDIRNESDAAQVATLVAATGIDMGAATADYLVMQGSVADALMTAGYRWVRLLDTYPVGAETWVCLEDDSWTLDDAMVAMDT